MSRCTVWPARAPHPDVTHAKNTGESGRNDRFVTRSSRG